MSPLIAMSTVISVLMVLLGLLWERYQNLITSEQKLEAELGEAYNQIQALQTALDNLAAPEHTIED